MSRRSSINPEESLNQNLYLRIIRLKKLNSVFEEEKEKEYKRLAKSYKSRNVFFIITFLFMCYFVYSLRKIEEKDKYLLKTSYQEIVQIIIVHISKSIETIPMKCIFLISLFNLISLIICQINFPCPKPLFIILLIQALLGPISILVPEFLIFMIFLMTCWLVPLVLYYCAKNLINEYRDNNPE